MKIAVSVSVKRTIAVSNKAALAAATGAAAVSPSTHLESADQTLRVK